MAADLGLIGALLAVRRRSIISLARLSAPHFLAAHISVQKMALAAMKRRAWSSGRMVRPNGPVGDQRSGRRRAAGAPEAAWVNVSPRLRRSAHAAPCGKE